MSTSFSPYSSQPLRRFGNAERAKGLLNTSESPEDFELRIAQSQLLVQLLTRIGYAVWQAAECEDTLAHYIVVRTRSSQGIGERGGLDLLRKAQSRTFGHMLRELRDAKILSSSLEARLSRLVEERNWLVHRAKRENRGVLSDLTQFNKLVERIDQIASDALELHKELGAELEEFVVASGVDRAEIDIEAAKLTAAWGISSGRPSER
jgi:hypothetical protein